MAGGAGGADVAAAMALGGDPAGARAALACDGMGVSGGCWTAYHSGCILLAASWGDQLDCIRKYFSSDNEKCKIDPFISDIKFDRTSKKTLAAGKTK